MIYLFSSTPQTLEAFFRLKEMPYVLVTKDTYDSFLREYVPSHGDLGIVYDFGKIIPQSLLDKLLLLNIHFSLLPKYRGATPVEAAILNGEKETGITIQKMVKAMDAGDILAVRKVSIDMTWTAGELQKHMDSLLPPMLEDILLIPMDKWNFSVQVGEPTFCYISLLKRESALLKISEMSTNQVLQSVRAYNPEPLAWVRIQKRNGEESTMNILRAEKYEEQLSESMQFIKKKGLAVKTLNGAVMLTEIVIAGQKTVRNGDIVALKGQFELR